MDNNLSQKDKVSHIKEYLEKNENKKLVDDMYSRYIDRPKKEKKKK